MKSWGHLGMNEEMRENKIILNKKVSNFAIFDSFRYFSSLCLFFWNSVNYRKPD